MTAILTNLVKAIIFAAVSLSGIMSLYAATNAFSVYTNLDVFVSGLLVIGIAVLLNPLFCFIAGYGLVFYSDRTLPVAVAVVVPALVGWCAAVARLVFAPAR